MRLYRLGENTEDNKWPFLVARHAYLADGTPLTETDERDRIVPARHALSSVEKITLREIPNTNTFRSTGNK